MGDLRDLPLLNYFKNFGIKFSGWIHCFCDFQEILTRILLVCTYTHLEPNGINYDVFWAGILK